MDPGSIFVGPALLISPKEFASIPGAEVGRRTAGTSPERKDLGD